MKNLTQPSISHISIHTIHHKPNNIEFRQVPVTLGDEKENCNLAKALLKGFNRDAVYRFSSGESGEISAFEIFVNEFTGSSAEFNDFSAGLAREWIKSDHEETKEHELIFCQFRDIQTGTENSIGYGIFLINSFEKFVQIIRTNHDVSIRLMEGVNLKKLKYSALIIPGADQNQADLYFKDNVYEFKSDVFIDRYLRAKPVRNNFYNTANHLNILKAYVDHELQDAEPLEKIEKIARTADYFSSHDHFDQKEYNSAIFDNPGQREAFDKFREQYAMDKDINIVDEFDVSPGAVKKNFSRIRSVIKLDRNFHVYVHGNRQNIVRGYDPERGKHYYQLFFDEES